MHRTIRNLSAATALAAVAATGMISLSGAAGATTEGTAPGVSQPADRLRVFTDAERQCLSEQGLSRPEGNLNPEQRHERREARRAAFDACGIERPLVRVRAARFLAGLTQEQRDCLREGVGAPAEQPRTRPATAERRQALKAAAEACGITLPTPPAQQGSTEPAS